MSPEMRPFSPARDAEAVGRILSLSFGGGWGTDHGKYLRKLPRAQWKFHRCLFDGDRLVAYLMVHDKQMYVGRALLRTAGIGAVCTDPSVRMKGYGRTLLEDAVAFMTGEGYDLSILYGIPNYYHKYGFETVMARHFMTVAQKDIPLERVELKRSAVSKADMGEILRLYNAQARFRDGNCRRKTMSPPKQGFKLTGGDGRAVAYACWSANDATMQVYEAAARDCEAAHELLQALRAVAWREGLTHVHISMPPGYPLTDEVAGLNSIYHRQYSFRGNCMGRVLNLASLARKMAVEWSRLVATSELSAAGGRAVLGVGDESLVIEYAKGAVSAKPGGGRASSTAAPERFAQMLMGYRSIDAIASGRGVTIARRDRRLFEVLFPERQAFLFGPDKF